LPTHSTKHPQAEASGLVVTRGIARNKKTLRVKEKQNTIEDFQMPKPPKVSFITPLLRPQETIVKRTFVL